jgi:hypothetical protein
MKPYCCQEKECKNLKPFENATGLGTHIGRCHNITREQYAQKHNTQNWNKCAYCEKFFFVQECRIGKTKCCSIECANKLKGKQTREKYENNIKVCEVCGKSLPYKKRNNTFCSRKCSKIGNKNGEGGRGTPHRNHTQEEIQYLREINCGSLNPMYNKSIRDYMTQEAWDKWLESRSGPGCIWYIDGRSTFPSEYDEKFSVKQRMVIKQRDDFLCVVCKKNKAGMSVHHIDYDKKNSSYSNLITLCPSCHSKTSTPNNRDYWQKLFQEGMGNSKSHPLKLGEIK